MSTPEPRRAKRRRIWNERAQRWELHEVLVCPRSDLAGKRREALRPVYRKPRTAVRFGRTQQQ